MKQLLIFTLVAAAAVVAADTRPPAVAGSFYPADGDELRAVVADLLSAARTEAEQPPSRALVVPHAGYAFSGGVAARAFATLPSSGIKRVILLGPSHHLSFRGGALPAENITAFATPLGPMSLDVEAIEALRRDPVFGGPTQAHDQEHALEVELPFLRMIAPDAALIPVVIGASTDLATCTALARSLAPFLDPSTVVIASSDFTHHGRRYGWNPFDGPRVSDTLLEVGRATAARVAARDPRGFFAQVEVSGDTVCGVRPITVLAELAAHAFDGTGRVLEVTTSGHLTGSFDLSVTYAAVAFSGEWRPWKEEKTVTSKELTAADGRRLVALARATLQGRLSHDTSVADWFAANPDTSILQMPAGAFVTLNNTGSKARAQGKLRACMGVIEARQPLLDAVIQAAEWATQDPRFPPLALTELDDLEIEVSVLSPSHPVPLARDIEVGRHGVVLSRDGRRAVFLPQVAVEQGWDRKTMLEHLSMKAGLPRDAWNDGATFEVFTAQVFEEGR